MGTQQLNLFSLVGPPSTRKSFAFKDAVMKHFENSDDIAVIGNTTSSGLTKLLSKKQSCFLANPEIFEYPNKMTAGDSQMLCKLFSDERCDLNYATENRRTLNADCSFCILGKFYLIYMNNSLTYLIMRHNFICRMSCSHYWVITRYFVLSCDPTRFFPYR